MRYTKWKENVKGILKTCLMLMSSAILFFIACIVFIILLYQFAIRQPPVDAQYIKQLEFLANDTLPSCKILKKKYKERTYEIVVFKLDEKDYEKVLSGIKSKKHYECDPNMDFISKTNRIIFWNKDITNFSEKYINDRGGEVIRKLGFKWPDRIVLEQTFR